jgi:spermidine synthase
MPEQVLDFPIRSNKLRMSVLASEHICHRKTELFGKVLMLDNHIQLTEFDERAYHESLVQLPLLSIEAPRSALVVGGGDGGVLRELCKHKSMERIDMVEIDGGVVEASREFLPELSGGAFDDPRVNLFIQDAFPFLKEAAGGQYDLIVLDSTDTYEDEEGALSEQLFTSDFYTDCRRALSETGIVVTQADNLVFCPYSMESILASFDPVFPVTGTYQALIPSFGGFSGFCWASNGAVLATEFPAGRASGVELRYLTRETYALAFSRLSF